MKNLALPPSFAPTRLLAYAVLLWLILGSCSSLNTVKVVGTNFTEEVNQTQNLVFTFNKNLVTESQLGSWDSTQYLQFEPALRGKFKWTAPNELVFSPTAALGAATRYSAKPTKELLKYSEEKYGISSDELSFHTPYLQVVATETWWTRSAESGRPEARLRLRFNYPVQAQNIVEKLRVSTNEQPYETRLLASPDASAVTLALLKADAGSDQALPLAIQLEKGLRPAVETDYTTDETLQLTSSLPSALHLAVSDIQTGFENNQGVVRVRMTQELNAESIEKGFGLSPSLSARAEPTDNGFMLRASFAETETYLLTLNTTLKGVLGATLDEDVTRDLFFGQMPSGITFTHKKAIYLSPKGARNVGVQIVNVPEVQVKIAKVYENNILSFVQHNRYADYDYLGDDWQPTGSFTYYDDEQRVYSDILVNKTLETANLPRQQGISALNLALPDDDGRRGVYLVSVSSKEEAYLGATRLVSISDIGLVAKLGKDELWVMANSIKTTEPLSGIEITLVSSNNQTMHTLTTDSQGMARIDKLSEKAPGFTPALVTARSKDDFNYLLLRDTQVETSRYEVEGLRDNSTGLQAFIYGPRDMYRPGETLHFNTVVRASDWKSVVDIPLKIKLLTPNGRELKSWRKTTNAQGAVEVEAQTEAGSLTGAYTLEVYNANDILIASKAVFVEEFIPDRIKVEVGGAKETYQAGQTLALTATALNLFGPPASNRSYEMESQLKRKRFEAPNFPDFSFDIPAEVSFERTVRQGLTNAQGQATERFVIPATYQDIGLLEGKIYVTVFDENGRPVNRLHRFEVVTQPALFGARIASRYGSINAPIPMEVIALSPQGKLLPNTSAEVEVVRIEYQTVVEKQEEQLRYASRRKEKRVYTRTLSLRTGREQFSYVPTVSGEYELRIRRPGANYYTATPFYAYGYGFTEYASFEVSTEGQVLVEMDKSTYQVGDKAKLLFKTPFDGRLLVTVERNQVLEHHVLTTDKRAAELRISLTDKHLPTVYVSATLIRPLNSSQLPLTVAHGFAPITVEDPKRRLEIAIQAPEKSRSKTKQRFTVKTAPNAQLTLAVVDEGILQIKNFTTPAIYGHFYQKRALEVLSHDLYAFLFPELTFAATSSTGGDGYDLQRRINPLSNGRNELVAFWSGTLTANGSGEASFEVEIPQFSGDLRVMAVAYKDQAFGSASKNMKVADPVVISTGAPRFLSMNDELSLPVTISNTESKPLTVTATIRAEGALRIEGKAASESLVIQPKSEVRTTFRVKAASQLGEGKLLIQVNALGQSFRQETALLVRPAVPLLKTSSSGSIAGGQKGVISLKHDFIPSTVRSQVTLSRSPLVQGGGKALATLLGYPYGCLEQRLSRAFPQLYFADLATVMAPKTYLVRQGESDFNPATNVQQTLQALESQQLYNGAFTLWPGGSKEDAWTTAYAVHFMEEAQRAGFEVKGTTLSRALDYLTAKTSALSTEELPIYYENGTSVRQVVAGRDIPYSLYVLALSGRPNRAAMSYYKQHLDRLTPDGLFLLAGAYQLVGDNKSHAELLPDSYTVQAGSYGGYSSPMQSLGLVLNTLLETDPDNLKIPPLARQLSEAVAAAPYLNTQEAAFAVMALGKIAKKAAPSTVTATLTGDGKALAPFTGTDWVLSKNVPRQLTVATQGKGALYWFATTEGITATGGFVEEDQGLRVRRQYLTRTGQVASTIRQNDLLVVKVSVSSTTGLSIPNVVVTDLLPAGFEIENPRITATREMSWIKQATTPDYFDIRDDRILFFTDVGAAEQTFYYQVRVVAKGTFAVGPVSADAMYQGQYRSYSGSGKLTVQ